MKESGAYVLDTSVFIQAARTYYALDIAPGFWKVLLEHAKSGSIVSTERVKREIDRGEDDLKNWVNNYFSNFFRSTDDASAIKAYGTLMRWAQSQTQYLPGARGEFAKAENADASVIAFAMAHRCIVVTQEKSKPDSKRRIIIPDVCHAFSILCIDTFEMMRRLGIKL